MTYKVMLWGGASDGCRFELASDIETEGVEPTPTAVHIAEITDEWGNIYKRSNRIKAGHWVYRYAGEGHGENQG